MEMPYCPQSDAERTEDENMSIELLLALLLNLLHTRHPDAPPAAPGETLSRLNDVSVLRQACQCIVDWF